MGLLTGNVTHGQRAKIFPRRYLENSRQPPTLIGLTADETLEFERLDRLSPVDHLGNCTWDFESNRKTPEQKRWLELCRKHGTGWRLLAAEGDWAVSVPYRPATSQIESGLKRWERDLRSGSRSAPERRANLPDRSWFPSIVSRTFKNALPEKVSLLARVKERDFSGAFLGLVLVTMAGWVYLLGSIFLKCVFWCFS